MKGIIIGAGSAGRNLAERLCHEHYEVVVIDENPAPLGLLREDHDLMTVVGSGSSPAVLREAGLDGADLLVAVTDCDEVNILACIWARIAGVRHKVARITNADFMSEGGSSRLNELGIDLAINPRDECAAEIAHMLRLPGTEEAIDLLEGRVLAVGFKVSGDSPLLRFGLKDCVRPDLLQTVRLIGLQRAGQAEIPHGDTRFMVGDDLYVVGEPDRLPPFLDVVYPDRPRIQKAVIAGGGALGLSLARQLESSGLELRLIERDEVVAQACADVLNRVQVEKGDVLSEEMIEGAGFGSTTAFVAATGDDEGNIIGCLLAQRAGACLTVAKVAKPDYVAIINNLSLLDRAVSPHLSMMNAILHFVRGKSVQSASLLHTLPGELLEVVLGSAHPWAGAAIRSLKMPDGAIIATIERRREIVVPTGDTELRAGDRLVLFALPGTIGRLESFLNR